jgi:hypothetical protein
MGRIICQWCTDHKVLMELEKINDVIYSVNNKIVDEETAYKITDLNYQNAINLLKENGYG